MATVHDVARRAGVSTSTVSHVVNRTRFVSDELRARVDAAMRELDYTPNAAARMLTLKRSHTIGLIVSDIRNPFFASVARGVEDVAQEQGYTLVLCNSDENAQREAACLNALETRAVDGVLLASAGVADEHLARLMRANFPIVLVDRDLPELGAPAALLDNECAAYSAVWHLLTRCPRRIGELKAIANRGMVVPDDVALVGFDDFPFPWSEAFRPHLTTVAQPTYELGRRAAELLVHRLKKSPRSIAAERVVLDGKLVVRD